MAAAQSGADSGWGSTDSMRVMSSGPQQQVFKILVHFGLKGLLYKRKRLLNQER